jgi:hypothetical protein
MKATQTAQSYKGLSLNDSFAFMEGRQVISDRFVLQIELTFERNRITNAVFFYSKNGICESVNADNVFFSGMFCGTSGLEITMTLGQALSCSHQGQCDDDVAYLLKNPLIQSQFQKMDKSDIVKALKEVGAWNEEELQDEEENQKRALWIAACDINEAD